MTVFDRNMKSYQIAVENFNSIAMDQEPADRLRYRSIAMEAVASPDAGMVLDRLYKSVMGRAAINFGKIPESNGDLTRFTKYKSLAESLSLLHRQLDEYNITELNITQELHDCIIRCREDFVYGFRADSQFLKTTYNTMVYSLCEMINLCDVIYIDMLKCGADGRPFEYRGYTDLLLVQNCQKFINMVKSGEWGNMVSNIRKDAKNLINFVFGADSYQDGMSALGNLAAPTGIFGLAYLASRKEIQASVHNRAWAAAGQSGAYNAKDAAHLKGAARDLFKEANKTTFGDVASGMRATFTKVKGTIPGRILIIILAIVATLFVIRTIIFLIYRGIYALRDILEDNERVLKAHLDRTADPSGTSKSRESQQRLYDMLSHTRDTIETKILKCDAQARKDLKESNATDFKPGTYSNDPIPPSDVSDDQVTIG